MKKKIRSIYIDSEVWKNAKELATQQNRSISTLIEELIKEKIGKGK